MIFTRTKRTAQKVADELPSAVSRSAPCTATSGQIAREKALKKFRKGKIDVLVATDVAARGIDIDDITHVINYQFPEDEKTYVHRIGRTGRAGQTGIAVTLVDWDDLPRWDDRQGAGPEQPRPRRDVLQLPAPLRRAGHPGRSRRQRRRTAQNADQARAAAGKSAERPARTRTRNRRRTRGGETVTGHPETTADQTATRRGRRERRRRRGAAFRPAPSPPTPAQGRGRERQLVEVPSDGWSNPNAAPEAMWWRPRRSRWWSPWWPR